MQTEEAQTLFSTSQKIESPSASDLGPCFAFCLGTPCAHTWQLFQKPIIAGPSPPSFSWLILVTVLDFLPRAPSLHLTSPSNLFFAKEGFVNQFSPSHSPPWPGHSPLPQSHMQKPPTHRPLEDSPPGKGKPSSCSRGISWQNSSQLPKPFPVIWFFTPPVPCVLRMPRPGPRLFSGNLRAAWAKGPGWGILALRSDQRQPCPPRGWCSSLVALARHFPRLEDPELLESW